VGIVRRENRFTCGLVLLDMVTNVVERRASTAVARTLSALVAFAAGIVGLAMVAVPGSTGRYFSWALGPPPLAALVGAFYLASTLTFGAAAFRAGWAGLRTLCVAVFALTLPTLASTARHRDVFDFGRWQAVAWVALFIASPLAFGSALSIVRRPVPALGPRLHPWSRIALAVSGAVYALVAVVVWAWPGAVASHGPMSSGGLGLRFIGAWAAFLAVLAVHAAARPGRHEARVPVLALVIWPLAALVAGLVHFDDLRAGAPRLGYIATLCVLVVVATAIAIGDRAVHGVPSPRRAAGTPTGGSGLGRQPVRQPEEREQDRRVEKRVEADDLAPGDLDDLERPRLVGATRTAGPVLPERG
jgi:hypothetical protein